MEEKARLAALEAALAELAIQQKETAERLRQSEAAFRRWRFGVVIAAALGCLLLPPFTRYSAAAHTLPVTKRLAALEQAVFGVTPVPPGTPSRFDGVAGAISFEANARQTAVGNLQSEVDAVHTTIDPFFAHVYMRDGVGSKTEVIFNAANVHIENGTGGTVTSANSLGNLIVGYNELGNPNGDMRSGSHNLVVGAGQSFSSFGCLVAGFQNTANGAYSAVSGTGNTTVGYYSSVNGGTGNTATGFWSCLSGGEGNHATGDAAGILGGTGVTVSSRDGHSP